jgi:hypothetical protein
MRRVTLCLVSVCLLVSAGSAQQPSTAVPNLIRYGGVIPEAQGLAVSSNTVGVTFSIYKQQYGGAPIWIETQNVATDAGGNYSVLLGSATASGLPSDLFSEQEQRWLGVQVQGQAEQPRVLLVSVPYAFKAHEAETLSGRSVSDFVLTKDWNTANVSGNGNTASSPIATGTPNVRAGYRGLATSQGPTNFTGSTTDQIVKVNQISTGFAINATAGGTGIVGVSTAGANNGVWGQAFGVGGFGVLGTANSSTGAAIGVKGSSTSPSGTGVRGIETSSTGNTSGVSAYVGSPTGTAGVFNNAAGGKILSGQNNGVEKFFVDAGGNINAGGGYEINGNYVLNLAFPSDDNLFVGLGAGVNNISLHGKLNTFVGFNAGNANSSGKNNAFLGAKAGPVNTTGGGNSFVGYGAGFTNADGSSNTFIGYLAGGQSDGSSNTFIGELAGYNNSTGASNVYIANEGAASGTESNAIRIGDVQSTTYIAGIFGSSVGGSGIGVFVDSNGQLGTMVSSGRFKEQVQDMGDSTNALMKLRPVTYLYKAEYDKGPRTLQYGLIAEEVAQVYPELVAYDNDGKPYTVRYQYLTSMLLNEAQKQYRRAQSQSDVIATQQQKIEQLEQRLTRLESLLDAKTKVAQDDAPRVTAGGQDEVQ